ncbi:MAG: hypothetical protein GX181_01695 [Synergistaceae bacterium]|nr:hypothetical protein [Synergistota bacterium]NLM70659.1 hypothetical protein [Synergistaceae bacterium]
MRERKRIDWDEEQNKTERIRWKGFRISLASFAMAALWIFGVGRMGVKEITLAPMVLLLYFVGAGTLLAVFLLRRKRK